jgi:hypothetical protein
MKLNHISESRESGEVAFIAKQVEILLFLGMAITG